MAIEVSRKRDIKRVELYPTHALNPLPASDKIDTTSLLSGPHYRASTETVVDADDQPHLAEVR